jgi:hypothetical protein
MGYTVCVESEPTGEKMNIASQLKILATQAKERAKQEKMINKPHTYEEWRDKNNYEVENAKAHLQEQLFLAAEEGQFRMIFNIPNGDNYNIRIYRVAANELGCSFVKRPNVPGQYSVSFASAKVEPKAEKINIPPYKDIPLKVDPRGICGSPEEVNIYSSHYDVKGKGTTEHPVF